MVTIPRPWPYLSMSNKVTAIELAITTAERQYKQTVGRELLKHYRAALASFTLNSAQVDTVYIQQSEDQGRIYSELKFSLGGYMVDLEETDFSTYAEFYQGFPLVRSIPYCFRVAIDLTSKTVKVDWEFRYN